MKTFLNFFLIRPIAAMLYGIGILLSVMNSNRFIFLINQLKVYFFRGFYKFSFKKIGVSSKISNKIDLYGSKYIIIGKNFDCLGPLRLEAHDRGPNNSFFNPKLVIGDNVHINYYCHIGCINKVIIGNNVLIASGVFITDHFHGQQDREDMNLPPAERVLYSKGPVIIGDNVWIGEGVAIMPNVSIGENTIIGANAVVTKSFPANSVIAGNPANEIKKK